MEKRYQEVNRVFLITTVIVLGISFVPLTELFTNYAAIFIVSQLIIFLPTLCYLFWSRQKYTEAVRLKKVSPSNVVLLFFFSFCVMSVTNLVNAISMTFAKNVISDAISDTTGSNSFIISLLCVAVIPAIFEESIYRGVFFQAYRKVNPLGAVFLSALLFGLMHGNLNQFSYAFCIGIILALVVEATDSIVSTMIIHFMINATSVVAMYALPKLEEIAASNNLTMDSLDDVDLTLGYVLKVYGPSAIIFGIGGYFLFRTIAKNCGRWEHIKNLFKKNENKPGRKLFTIPLIIAIVFWVVIMIALEVLPA